MVRNPRELIRELREEMRDLEVCIATFERLAALREPGRPSRNGKPKVVKRAKKRAAKRTRE